MPGPASEQAVSLERFAKRLGSAENVAHDSEALRGAYVLRVVIREEGITGFGSERVKRDGEDFRCRLGDTDG